MSNCVFTICAANYIGLAQVLERSLKSHNSNITFYIFVADDPSSIDKLIFPNNVLFAKDVLSYSKEKWYELSFKYDLTEFCTCIKPKCFEYLFDSCSHDKMIYLDPDILIFNDITSIFDTLNNYSILITPHITQIETDYTGNLEESKLLYSGAYNLGFLALKRNDITRSFLSWWANRLEDKCFRVVTENLFTDQKWIDLIPSFFGVEVKIERDLGMNVAPWNFHEREIKVIDNELFVVNRLDVDSKELSSLLFVHFSGYDYLSLLNGAILQQNISSMYDYPDLESIFSIYKECLLHSDFKKFIHISYSYNKFYSGEPITPFIRKLYRRLVETSDYKENPFSCDSLFYKSCKKEKIIIRRKVFSNNSAINLDNKQIFKKIKIVNTLFSFLLFIIGINRYVKVLKAMRVYSIQENHYFLIKEEKDNYKIRYI